MSPIDTIKAEAVALREKEKASGREMKHSEALEIVARKHGFNSWRACRATSAGLTAAASPRTEKPLTGPVELKRYESSSWRFSLEIPKRWNSFPAVQGNSPYEVIRFASHEDGVHLLIIFRQPFDPKRSLHEHSAEVQRILANAGFGNFASSETKIRAKTAEVLDFDKSQGDGTWSCRHYFIAAGTLCFTLGFGTTRSSEIFGLFDRVAKTFEISGE